jgi:quinoprotein glucose dehydrogenase
MRVLVALLLSAFLVVVSSASLAAQQSPGEWTSYGRDPGVSRYSPLTQITRENVSQLRVAWTFNTGEMGRPPERGAAPSLEATPLMVDGTLYVSTPRGRVIALDPLTGRERWRYDARVPPDAGYGDYNSRGVSTWLDPQARPGARCRRRIFFASVDARLIALDAATGALCTGFGNQGTLDLRQGLRIPPAEFPAYEQTSPPAIINGLVVVGSAIADNFRTDPASGEVRAFDARTGALRWIWDPIPQDASDPAHATWRNGSAARTGGANVWSVIAADPERDLVFVPTSSPAPDFYGGMRLGENRYANSIVALRASTGRVVWHFQTVHHDLWDFDNAAPPTLVSVRRNGQDIPAVLQATKTGMLFVLHRETGEPIFPVEERPVPASDVPGEQASPTQPFTVATPPLVPHTLHPDSVFGVNAEDRGACREVVRSLRNEGIFTPPSLRGTLLRPSNIGGAHWGGVAADASRGIAVVPVNQLATIVHLIPAASYDPESARREMGRMDWQYTRMRGTPYVMRRRIFLSPAGVPCTPPPFGTLVAVNLGDGSIRWNVPLGSMPGAPAGAPSGSPNLGGPMVTATGVVFMAGTLDRAIRAFDIETGRELWRAELPAGGKATPMTYEAQGRQFVVIAAGGGDRFGDGDAFVAFALPNGAR